jgi:hypothetical protein
MISGSGGMPFAFLPLAQRLALQVLHDEIRRPVRKLPIVRDLHDARVVDQVDRTRLIKEARANARVLRVLRVKDLDGNPAADGILNGFIHRSHSTFAQLANDLIWTESIERHFAALTGHYTGLGVPLSLVLVSSTVRKLCIEKSGTASRQVGSCR